MKAAKAAAEGNVTKTAVMRYPRRVSTLTDYHATVPAESGDP